MTKLFKTSLAFIFMLICIPAFAGSCPKDMKAVDAALAENPSLSAEDMSRVKELRAEGEKLHKSGKHADSVAALHEALKLLGK